MNQIPKKSADYNRLGFVLQLCTLRFLGFCPDDLKTIPFKVIVSEKIVRLGVTTLERMVITARQRAQEETYRRLNFLMSDKRKAFLDDLLVPYEGRTPLSWLRRGAESNTPENILKNVEKLNFLYEAEVDHWDLSVLNPNRRKFLAKIGRRSTNQALQRMNSQRRYPILISFLRQSLEDIIDELIELFDRCLAVKP